MAWEERALSHEYEANAGKAAAKLQESYGWFGGKGSKSKIWKVPDVKKYLQARGISVSTKKGKN